MSAKITADHLERTALVYVRQSTPGQVRGHVESQRRQYALADVARDMGFRRVDTIDDDLGISGSGFAERPGFQRLLTTVGSGAAGAVLALEASRLARNDRDWSQLVELGAITKTVLIDHDGIYDPRLVNDRLLLGVHGELQILSVSNDFAGRSPDWRSAVRVPWSPNPCSLRTNR
jgi:DNA invertase Pin-like site-specific DNA recombinase